MWRISKEFDIDYGHRVWNQKLDYEEFSISTKCACRHLHGHRGKIIVTLEGTELENSMVTDFHNLNWLKKFLDDTLDHKFIFDIHDPMIEHVLHGKMLRNNCDCRFPPTIGTRWVLQRAFESIPVDPIFLDNDIFVGYEIKNMGEKGDLLLELFGGITLVSFVPTSENFSKWLYDIVSEKMKRLCVVVSSIEWQETPKSKAVYYGK